MSLKRSSTTQSGNMTFSRGDPDEQQAEAVHHESNESGINYNNELKQFAVCWTGDSEKKNKPTHFTINLGCALGKVQRVGTGLTQTVPPQAPMRGLSALNGDLKELRSQAQAPDELLH